MSNVSRHTRFHFCHGENVLLLEDRTVALRYRGFADAMVFSERPLRSGEIFAVEIELKDQGWNGHMRLGLTTFVPSEGCSLPKYSLPDLCSAHPSWIIAVSKRFMFDPMVKDTPRDAMEIVLPGNALKPKSHCRFVTDSGSRLAIMYLATGRTAQMFFISNGDEVKMFADSIPISEPLYAVVDVYGKTRQIRLVPLNNTTTLLAASRDAIVSSAGGDFEILKRFVDNACIPVHLKQYLLSQSRTSV